MYNKIEATVLNGSTSYYFKLERGVRQGCPLSAYLFLVVIETLANKIRNNKSIEGIRIDRKEIKISLLADDITLLLTNLKSLKNSLILLKSFQQCSGLKINIEKTQSKYIGSLSNNDYYPHGLSWIKTPIKILGIVITTDDESNYIHNFQQRILNFKSILNIWKQRNFHLRVK